MKRAIFILMLSLSQYCGATVKIAVIDSGFDFESKWILQPKLCKTGHKDFTGQGIQDTHGHGTHIAGLIAKYAGDSDYCLVIVKFFDVKDVDNSLKNSVMAIKYAVSLGVDVINYSGGGVEANNFELLAVKSALNSSIIFVAAAGNEDSDLSEIGYYPALYDRRVIVVGALNRKNKRLLATNYGTQIDVFEVGEQISILPGGKYGWMAGTSQATAVHTGKIVKNILVTKKLTQMLTNNNFKFK